MNPRDVGQAPEQMRIVTGLRYRTHSPHISRPMKPPRQRLIRNLFKRCMHMYASRDPRIFDFFSERFSGYTGGGRSLVSSKAEWADITRLDFAQVPKGIRIEIRDLLVRDLSETVVLATGLYNIHLPIPEPVFSREPIRMSLVFTQENGDWKIVHSGSSAPHFLVQEGEVLPLKGLYGKNQELSLLLKERTRALDEAIVQLDALKQVSHQVRTYLESRLESDPDIDSAAASLAYSRRTLTRRLREEGSSFLKIKDQLRRTLALQLLATTRLPVEAISARVGFADLSTFHRAFKKWTGTTPQVYQRSAG